MSSMFGPPGPPATFCERLAMGTVVAIIVAAAIIGIIDIAGFVWAHISVRIR